MWAGLGQTHGFQWDGYELEIDDIIVCHLQWDRVGGKFEFWMKEDKWTFNASYDVCISDCLEIND